MHELAVALKDRLSGVIRKISRKLRSAVVTVNLYVVVPEIPLSVSPAQDEWVYELSEDELFDVAFVQIIGANYGEDWAE